MHSSLCNSNGMLFIDSCWHKVGITSISILFFYFMYYADCNIWLTTSVQQTQPQVSMSLLHYPITFQHLSIVFHLILSMLQFLLPVHASDLLTQCVLQCTVWVWEIMTICLSKWGMSVAWLLLILGVLLSTETVNPTTLHSLPHKTREITDNVSLVLEPSRYVFSKTNWTQWCRPWGSQPIQAAK